MDEKKIQVGVKLLENDFGGKAIPIEEKHELLRKQMTEEEVTEVFRRFKEKKDGAQINTSQPAKQSTVQHALNRIQQTDRHFQPAANGGQSNRMGGGESGGSSLATTASVSIISALGLTFLLDKYKDK